MTTWSIPREQQSRELADALTRAIEIADLDARTPLSELRVAASVDNKGTVAAVAWNVRGSVSRALRLTAAEMRAADPEGTPDPVAVQLENIATGLDQSVEAYRANNRGRI